MEITSNTSYYRYKINCNNLLIVHAKPLFKIGIKFFDSSLLFDHSIYFTCYTLDTN